MVGSRTTDAIAGAYGACGLAMLAPVLAWTTPVPLVAAAAVAAVVFQSLPSVVAVVRNAHLHEHAKSLTRATTMSAVALAFSLVRLPVLLAAGAFADVVSLTAAVVAGGAGALLVGALVVCVDGPLVDGDDGARTERSGHADVAD